MHRRVTSVELPPVQGILCSAKMHFEVGGCSWEQSCHRSLATVLVASSSLRQRHEVTPGDLQHEGWTSA